MTIDAPTRSPETAVPGWHRRTWGGIRLLAVALVVASIATQITEQVADGSFDPSQYFVYFTIQSSLMNIVVLGAAAVLAFMVARDSEFFTAVRMCIVVYGVITGAVYNLLLRGIQSNGFVGEWWPNEVIHVVIPIYLVVDWVVAPGRARLRFGWLALAISYPLLWVAATLVRAEVDGWVPYPFVDVDGPDGVSGVVLSVVQIALAIVGLAVAAILVSRVGAAGARPRVERSA
ncbi:Pr6Pr family membrane protein [Marisediminicola sp. LYQ134]|uniref:Pr6Pr family membrane protein n=1 Tax=unclassified Marisediminicola TaxID=2618316 RepID=UPI003982D983